jgi:abortive infection bacteriophage resistance protein
VANYSKPPLTVTQQIALLEGRGMRFGDKSAAEHYLTHISYYRLRAYWLPLEDAEHAPDHIFQPGVSFEDALALYVFDRELRLLVLDAIERIEVSFRTGFTHSLALAYGAHPHLTPSLFGATYEKCLTLLVEEIERSSETFIAHYKRAYSNPPLPPIWAVSEVMSFGLISRWYKALASAADRQKIAGVWDMDETVVVSLVHHLAYVRNLCAHHARLWNRRFTVTMKIPRSPGFLSKRMSATTPRQIHNTLVMLAYVLDLISPGHTWMRRLTDLLSTLPPKVSHRPMGFPDDWRIQEPWLTKPW